jgi:cytochrome P450
MRYGLHYRPSSVLMASSHWVQTTAHTLCYVFLLLAIFPDEQEKLYDHIKEVIGDREPVRAPQDSGFFY